MEKSTKILLITLASLLGLAGVVLIMFFKKSNACGGFAFICFGVAMILLGVYNKFEYDENREILDEAMDEFKRDNEQNNQLYDPKTQRKAVKKMYRKFNKTRTHYTLMITGAILIVVSFFIF